MDPDKEWATWRTWLGDEPKGETIYAQVVEMLAFRRSGTALPSFTTARRRRLGRTRRSCGGFDGTMPGRKGSLFVARLTRAATSYHSLA